MSQYKRSHEPLVWSLFGAGGMVAALVTPVLILCTGLLAPLGLADGLSFEHVSAFANHWLGGLILWAIIALPLWHALHRIYHGLHDLKVGARPFFYVLCYGAAAVLTLFSGYWLMIG